jgi:hypothetical protein
MDRGSLVAQEKSTMSHSLPVQVPSFGRRVRFDSPDLSDNNANNNNNNNNNDEEGGFQRPDVIAANTYQEQMRSEWVAKTKLGKDDVDFLVATHTGVDRGPRKKTMI